MQGRGDPLDTEFLLTPRVPQSPGGISSRHPEPFSNLPPSAVQSCKSTFITNNMDISYIFYEVSSIEGIYHQDRIMLVFVISCTRQLLCAHFELPGYQVMDDDYFDQNSN
jgi:hypothetical protein